MAPVSQSGYAVSLIVKHPSADPIDIAAKLGLVAKFTQTAGMPRTTPKGRPVGGIYKESYCCFCFRMEETLQPTLLKLVDLLERRRAVVQALVAEGGQINCSINVSGAHDPVLIAAEVLKRCAELSVAIEISTYRVLQERWEHYENQLTEG